MRLCSKGNDTEHMHVHSSPYSLLFSSLYPPTLYVHIHDRLTVTTYRAQHLSPCQEQLRVRGEKCVCKYTEREHQHNNQQEQQRIEYVDSKHTQNRHANMENRMAGKRTEHSQFKQVSPSQEESEPHNR